MEKPNIPTDPKEWPTSWTTIFFKEYPRFDTILLPKKVLGLKNLNTVLIHRTSSRTFNTKKEISLQELSTMLYYSAGIKENSGNLSNSIDEEKNVTRRFYPSGGARYPIEVYLAVKRVSRVTPGIYHYNILNHSLERLLGADALSSFDETLDYPWAKDAAIVFIVTVVWNRNFIKYGDFGYNLVLIETGHMIQNLLLVSESLDIRHCPIAGFSNEGINTILDISHDDESSLYVIAIGK